MVEQKCRHLTLRTHVTLPDGTTYPKGHVFEDEVRPEGPLFDVLKYLTTVAKEAAKDQERILTVASLVESDNQIHRIEQNALDEHLPAMATLLVQSWRGTPRQQVIRVQPDYEIIDSRLMRLENPARSFYTVRVQDDQKQEHSMVVMVFRPDGPTWMLENYAPLILQHLQHMSAVNTQSSTVSQPTP